MVQNNPSIKREEDDLSNHTAIKREEDDESELAEEATEHQEREYVAAATPDYGPSKMLITNLPEDVTEALIWDFFATTIGSIEEVVLHHDFNGYSLGSATVLFTDSMAATKALDSDGLRLNGRPMGIEVIRAMGPGERREHRTSR